VELGGGSLSREARRVAAELAADTVASRITDADPSFIGRASADGLGWPALPHTSRPLIGQVDALREAFRVEGAARVLLVGDARWTLGAEVLAGAGERPATVPMVDSASSVSAALLQVLDTPDPGVLAHALAGDLSGTVLVVTDPAGTTEWVAAVHAVLAEAIAAEIGPRRAAARTVVLTEAGSPLDERARAAGSVVITTERDVPAEFCVLGAPGLVPAGLAGAPVGGILEDARAVAEPLTADDPRNPALLLAGVLVACGHGAVRVDPGLAPPALAEWAACLVAAAGGTPVLLDDPDPDGLPTGPTLAPSTARDPMAAPDDLTELLGPTPRRMPDDPDRDPEPDGLDEGDESDDTDEVVATGGPLGAELLLWQYAAAAAARLLDGEPFADPRAPAAAPLSERSSDGVVAVSAGDWLPGEPSTTEALQALVDAVPAGGHLAVSGWLDPIEDASVAVLRGELARRAELPVAFGWGPRQRALLAPFGGEAPRPGALLLLTGDAPDDLVPDPGPVPSSLARTEAGIVAADVAARGVPVLRLHLSDRVAGLVLLARAVQGLRPRPDPAGRED
jgi:glucose-6-phosphate isomerase